MGRLAGSEVLTSYWNEEQFRKELKEICNYTVIARQKMEGVADMLFVLLS